MRIALAVGGKKKNCFLLSQVPPPMLPFWVLVKCLYNVDLPFGYVPCRSPPAGFQSTPSIEAPEAWRGFGRRSWSVSTGEVMGKPHPTG